MIPVLAAAAGSTSIAAWGRSGPTRGRSRPARARLPRARRADRLALDAGVPAPVSHRRHRLATSRSGPPGRYAATAWYSPELQRVVRFEAKSRGGASTAAFWIDEQLQLVDIRDN